MVSVSASINLPLHHKVQKFSSGTGSPGWSRKKGRKTVVVESCYRESYVAISEQLYVDCRSESTFLEARGGKGQNTLHRQRGKYESILYTVHDNVTFKFLIFALWYIGCCCSVCYDNWFTAK